MTDLLKSRIAELSHATGRSGRSGCVFDEVGMLVASMVRLYRPEIVIQTGHLWGKSALFILEALAYTDMLDTGPQGDSDFARFVRSRTPVTPFGILHSIDPGPVAVPDWAAGVDLLKSWYGEHFFFHHMSSEVFFKSGTVIPGGRIMGFVDGDHSEAGCAYDLDRLAELGARLIVVDDTDWLPDLKMVALGFSHLKDYDFLNLPYFSGLGILVKRD